MTANHEQHVIETVRLELHLVSPKVLQQLFDGTFDNSLILEQGFTNPHNVLIDRPNPVRWRAPQVAKDITLNRWFIRWIVLRDIREVIGSISFHAPPNGSGMIEVGLEIVPEFQNNGYAKEALKAFWLWAIVQPDVKILRYTVSPDNAASLAVIQNFGFDYVGQQIDEEDGPEDIYEMNVDEFKSLYCENDN